MTLVIIVKLQAFYKMKNLYASRLLDKTQLKMYKIMIFDHIFFILCQKYELFLTFYTKWVLVNIQLLYKV